MNYQDLPKLTIIVGAGASYDVANEGTCATSQWRPPLACELFRIDKRPNFGPLLHAFSGAAQLAQDLAPKSAHDKDFNLEKELRRYADHPNEPIQRLFKEIPLYLRAVIVECCKQYVAWPGCFAQLIKATLAEHPHRVLFLVLNYDTYVERALEGYEGSFRRMSDYTDGARQAIIVKVHGSIDWFIRHEVYANDWREALRSLDTRKPLRPVELLWDLVGATEPFGSAPNGWTFPVLTAPLAGKGPTSLVCPDEHLMAAREFLGNCRKFLVIGTSGRDDDLFHLLDSSLTPGEPRTVHFVDPVDVEAVSQRYRDAVSRFRGARIVKHARGFRKQMLSSDFTAFLRETDP